VAASATIEVLADQSRRQILDALRSGEQPVHALVERLELSQPAVSKHLRVLQGAGLVTSVPQGREVLYQRAEDSSAIEEARMYLERMSRGWDQALAAFKRFAEAEEDS